MANTTNYNWETPDDTDLVKDGALAIRTFGSAVDSTVFANAGAAIAKTIVDAKGDIIAATAADTVARLAVGANNTVLTADSSTATGLKWAAAASGGKVLQVVIGSDTTQTTSTSTTFADTGLSATITPTSATSKILVIANQNGITKFGDTAVRLRLLRGATELTIFEDGAAYNNNGTVYLGVGGSGLTYLDEPATTSATTYKTQLRTNASGVPVYTNYNVYGSNSYSSITLLEIGA
jgi:hypothetical protein